ncbi:hypothetical protein [Amycolatopsis sp. 195334CR]|uniref:hypothetical protein n=1 Tax=Amycolatopsis sp. 195334CR TaxID=2814588 RepID=UPI001A903EEA|nr:hypothetical protein [Amycolatopsis sp. 195334CR]MBN6034075.1 hypothetical protein [Amycolatopsis sp. 195334CR]
MEVAVEQITGIQRRELIPVSEPHQRLDLGLGDRPGEPGLNSDLLSHVEPLVVRLQVLSREVIAGSSV